MLTVVQHLKIIFYTYCPSNGAIYIKYNFQMLDNRQHRTVISERRETKTHEHPGFLLVPQGRGTPKEHRYFTELRKQSSKSEATEGMQLKEQNTRKKGAVERKSFKNLQRDLLILCLGTKLHVHKAKLHAASQRTKSGERATMEHELNNYLGVVQIPGSQSRETSMHMTCI